MVDRRLERVGMRKGKMKSGIDAVLWWVVQRTLCLLCRCFTGFVEGDGCDSAKRGETEGEKERQRRRQTLNIRTLPLSQLLTNTLLI